MFRRSPVLAFFILVFAASSAPLLAAPFGVEALGERDSTLSEKRVQRQMWQSRQKTDLMQKTFPIQEWDKHFSSVGSKRAPITLSEEHGKQMFKTSKKEFPVKDFEMSRWNQRMAELHEQARISTDDRARAIADKKLYGMMLQDTRKYADMAEELSLRDINRFQYRHNRSDGPIPVQAAGAGQ